MEFDELQKRLGHTKQPQPLYAINEEALHNRIQSKMRQGYHITNYSELLLIIVNLGTGSFILALNLFKKPVNIFHVPAGCLDACHGFVFIGKPGAEDKGRSPV